MMDGTGQTTGVLSSIVSKSSYWFQALRTETKFSMCSGAQHGKGKYVAINAIGHQPISTQMTLAFASVIVL